mgnify:CR=1 FL=1
MAAPVYNRPFIRAEFVNLGFGSEVISNNLTSQLFDNRPVVIDVDYTANINDSTPFTFFESNKQLNFTFPAFSSFPKPPNYNDFISLSGIDLFGKSAAFVIYSSNVLGSVEYDFGIAVYNENLDLLHYYIVPNSSPAILVPAGDYYLLLCDDPVGAPYVFFNANILFTLDPVDTFPWLENSSILQAYYTNDDEYMWAFSTAYDNNLYKYDLKTFTQQSKLPIPSPLAGNITHAFGFGAGFLCTTPNGLYYMSADLQTIKKITITGDDFFNANFPQNVSSLSADFSGYMYVGLEVGGNYYLYGAELRYIAPIFPPYTVNYARGVKP